MLSSNGKHFRVGQMIRSDVTDARFRILKINHVLSSDSLNVTVMRLRDATEMTGTISSRFSVITEEQQPLFPDEEATP